MFDINQLKKDLLRKYPAFGSTLNNLKFEFVGKDHPIDTAATDGKKIYINVDYMNKLTPKEQLFIFAHEISHVACDHINRCKGRDMLLWNIATDAVINQNLARDGLPIKNGSINIKEAIKYDAETMYEKLQQEQFMDLQMQGQRQRKKEKPQSQKKNKKSKMKTPNNHSMWEESAKQNLEEREKLAPAGVPKEGEKKDNPSEKQIFANNNKEKIRKAQEIMKKIQAERRKVGQNEEVSFEYIGEAAPAVYDWKRKLKRMLGIEDEKWGRKFSDKTNNYALRIEDVEEDEDALIEVMLDVSGSVSDDLLRDFLKQLKTIFKESSKIRVGTYSDEFNGWTVIKSNSDIDKLKFKIGGGTNYDEASKAFSRDKDVNKICLTDGDIGLEIQDKRKDILWISYKNQYFHPDNGKVIYVPAEKLNMKEEECQM